MPPPACEIDTIAIVLLGSFNPAIFQPRWLGRQNLVAEGEAEEATVEVIHPDRASFEIGSWLKVQVFHDRFEASTSAARALPLRDFVVGLFETLEHTPVNVVGLNRLMHFRMESQKARDAIGYHLAPPTAWPTKLHDSKMVTVRMQAQRPEGALTITVEPSFTIRDVGVFVGANEQFSVPIPERDGAVRALELLQTHFDASVHSARELAEEIVRSGGGGA